MDQNQALAYLEKVVDDAKLTKSERDTAEIALELLHGVAKMFTQMTLERRAADATKKKVAEAPKPTIDNTPKHEA